MNKVKSDPIRIISLTHWIVRDENASVSLNWHK